MFFDGLSNKSAVVGAMNDLAYAYIPSRTPCSQCGGVDGFTGGPKDINCASCNGTGYETTWKRTALRCRIYWLDPASVEMYRGVVSTGLIGDVVISGRVEDERVYEKVRSTDGAYILIDGSRRVKVTAISRSRIRNYTTVEARCEVVREEE